MSTSTPKQLQGRNENHVAWLLRRIWERVNVQNEHFMGAIVGREGSGKSYTAIKIADNVDPTFSHERVIFDVAELLEKLRDGEHDVGNFYVLDEAGVQLGRRTWQERAQVLTNQALQLIRDHNLGLLFTLPRLSELDSQAQGRLQAFLEITEKVEGDFVRGKWKWMDPDRTDQTGEIYKKYPRRIMDGQRLRITSLAFNPPRENLTEPYEEVKSEFQEQFYDTVISELRDEVEDEDEADGPSINEIATEIAADKLGDYVSRHAQNNQPFINKNLIRADYELSHADAETVKSLLERQFDADDLEAYL